MLSAGSLTQCELQAFGNASFSDLVMQAVCHYKVPAGAIALKSPGGMKLSAGFGIRHTFIHQASDGSNPMCLHHTGVDSPIIIEDTKRCERVAKDVLVAHEPHVRFFAGAPLRIGNMVFGTLCIFDWTPRFLSIMDSEMLSQLACQISATYASLNRSKVVSINSRLSLSSLFSASQECLSDPDSRETLSDTEGEEDASEWHDGGDQEKRAKIESKSRAGKCQAEKFVSEATTAAGEAESSYFSSHSDSEPITNLRSQTWHSGFDGSTPSACDWSRCHVLTSATGQRVKSHVAKRSFTEGDKPWTEAGQTLAREKACAVMLSMQPSSLDSKLRPEMSLLKFLQLLGLEKYHSDFEKEEIDMQSLHLLSDKDLASLGIKMGPRRIIQAALGSLSLKPS